MSYSKKILLSRPFLEGVLHPRYSIACSLSAVTANVAPFSFGRLWFTHLKGHIERRATLWQHLIDRIQKALPSMAIGQGKPLQHHELSLGICF